ncbi:MAG: type II toxin-antitoxin system YoeB family toxin [Synergistaceae bacterium]|nr:type II toxin-antitoxin system YoeB family toxin [Synergistaceae bacterium]
MNGIGKPEVLRHVQGYSRRIDEQHRPENRFLQGPLRIKKGRFQSGHLRFSPTL